MKSVKIVLFVLMLMIVVVPARLAAQNAVKITNVKRPSTATANKFYTGNKAPLAPLAFVKLPVGSIRPNGWILKYLELQRDGLTGKLGEISAWLDKNNNAWFSGTGKGDHGWEEVPYWLKGYGNLGYILKDEKIVAETKLWLDKVFQSQQPNGYFGPAFATTDIQEAKAGLQDMWPNMLMLWCMQSYYEYSNDARVIPFMTKYFKWQSTVPEAKLLKIYWENSRGGDNLYSIYWLYNRTGEKWLLDLANKIHRNTADWSQKDRLPNWHNVNIAQCFREPATYYMQTKDSSFLNATYNDFYLVRSIYGQVPGGMFGADENARKGFDDPRQAVETCGMVEQMASDEILTGITGDPMWADHCEEVAFNTYPAAVMPDFKGLRYLTAPNMVVSDSRNHAPGIQNEGPFLMMNPFSSRCCQHNHAQGWPYYAEHLWMATPDNGIAALLYNSSEVTAKVGTGKGSLVTLKQTTHYPFDENIKIEINTKVSTSFPLYLRIPNWCSNATIWVNGVDEKVVVEPGSYARIETKWKQGDVVELMLPMKLKKQDWTKNKNSVSISYGPLTFSLKIDESYKMVDSKKAVAWDSKWQPNADQSKWPSYEIYPASMWNYGLALNDQPLESQFEMVKKAWPENDFPFTEADVPFMLKAKGKIIPEWILDKYGLCDVLPQSPVTVATKEQPIELIPMGAARLRIASFPVVK
ncbi:glycoside hydrolase family 127 protein [Ferruginibacter paludis]|uniref:beta-L-arabinofuranosidase domain-containing protein n=1 Tax=Ferruginibacter paludis TaxID=1310417 RepID=UPI0025B56F63|nr:beta-L-arabinofuranosidase domain-containing protein [Ferruginibacter paludis]MDN3656877.1 glycoside hydrolase family 127 protein [Ferruginibacter paludis]